MFRKAIDDKFSVMSRDELDKISKPLDWADIKEKMDTVYTNSSNTTNVPSNKMTSNPAAYVHIAEIIRQRATDWNNFKHREIVAEHHPWQNANIYKVAEHLTMNRPIFAVKDAEDEEPEEDEHIIEEWDRLRLGDLWKKSVEKGRKHGWILYYPLNPDTLPPYYTGPPWHVYTKDEATEMEWDAYGHPIKWQIRPSNIHVAPFQCNVLNAYFFDPNNTDDFDGKPEGMAIWDDLIDYCFIREAINSFDQRIGNGFMVVVVPSNTKASEVTDIETKLSKLRTEMGLVIRNGNIDIPVQVEWQSVAQTVNFIEHLNKIEDMFALAMGFPKRWLLGDAEGAMESSGKDALQVNIKLKAIFTQWIPFIKGVLRWHDLISEFNDIEVRAPFEMQLSEQEKVQLDQIKTQTIAAKAWLTDDEKRELDGYEPMTAEQKSEKMAMMAKPMIGGGNPEDKKEGKTSQVLPERSGSKEVKKEKKDAIDLLTDVFTSNGISIDQLAELTGVSHTTISKMRAKLDAIAVPKLKEDDIMIKCDAVQIDNTIYRIADVPVVLPQRKYYEKYGKYAVRPREEVERIFKDPTTPKEYRIGITPTNDHSSRVPLEVLKENAVGVVKFKRLDEEGRIRADIEYDVAIADKILGSENNWLRAKSEKNEDINTSVAMYTKDRPSGEDAIESNLDIRSFVFTTNPRNEEAGV